MATFRDELVGTMGEMKKLKSERLELIAECRQLAVRDIPAAKNEEELKAVAGKFRESLEKIAGSYRASGIDLKENEIAKASMDLLKIRYANEVTAWFRNNRDEFRQLGNALMDGVGNKKLAPLEVRSIIDKMDDMIRPYNVKLAHDGKPLFCD